MTQVDARSWRRRGCFWAGLFTAFIPVLLANLVRPQGLAGLVGSLAALTALVVAGLRAIVCFRQAHRAQGGLS
jgi:hypothetical protein